jgi:hypothetical protein
MGGKVVDKLEAIELERATCVLNGEVPGRACEADPVPDHRSRHGGVARPRTYVAYLVKVVTRGGGKVREIRTW